MSGNIVKGAVLAGIAGTQEPERELIIILDLTLNLAGKRGALAGSLGRERTQKEFSPEHANRLSFGPSGLQGGTVYIQRFGILASRNG